MEKENKMIQLQKVEDNRTSGSQYPFLACFTGLIPAQLEKHKVDGMAWGNKTPHKPREVRFKDFPTLVKFMVRLEDKGFSIEEPENAAAKEAWLQARRIVQAIGTKQQNGKEGALKISFSGLFENDALADLPDINGSRKRNKKPTLGKPVELDFSSQAAFEEAFTVLQGKLFARRLTLKPLKEVVEIIPSQENEQAASWQERQAGRKTRDVAARR